ncbi:phospholipase D family protein [Pseudomonas sp. OIL-1]|uniref:phospholipase D family protein n=1 Tax=Pseudomonas sp. OIL-1 TaxID=2706126 RepID=UPI0013A7A291|nr:phospholipase D family protein [Pseudomonas sp. OIL-1]QIB50496.1 phospholipase D family protein [Pseudomonas sp. OIL-1]
MAYPSWRRLGNVASVLLVICSAGLLAGCSLPTLEGRSVSSVLLAADARETRLGQAIAPRVDAHPGKSGIYPLADPYDAFAARMLLAQAAERTLDVQYYIWHDDNSGRFLLDALHDAAERGVRVRLLLDDNGTAGLDTELAALDSHPQIEVRLFNPFAVRSLKWIGFLTNFSRANRRMHNKSFTADAQATIVGGRNIGDEYFGAAEGVLFADLDVLAVGPIVGDVGTDFDRYWASESAYPVEGILPAVGNHQLEKLTEGSLQPQAGSMGAVYLQAVRQSEFMSQLLDGALELGWAKTRMVSDDPAKGQGALEGEGLLTHQLGEILDDPVTEVVLVSPYFVPTASGVDAFADLVARGVSVRVLTNSLNATDVTAVHAGYAKRRKDLLNAGIELFEMRRMSPQAERNESVGPFGSSASSLHAKTFSVDRDRIFVGSFNFDPRSANLNTELGFVIDSPTMARQISRAFDTSIPANAYVVQLDDDGQLVWIEQRGDQLRRYDSEPHTGLLRRVGVLILSILPIEWLL